MRSLGSMTINATPSYMHFAPLLHGSSFIAPARSCGLAATYTNRKRHAGSSMGDAGSSMGDKVPS